MVSEEEKYVPLNNYKTVEIDGSIANWGDFAIENGTTYRMLKVYNPWLVSSSLVNKNKKTTGYSILVGKFFKFFFSF